jgi:hypothetical protein
LLFNTTTTTNANNATPFLFLSYLAVGSTPSDIDELRQDVNGQIFFAGEACSREYPSMVTIGGVLFLFYCLQTKTFLVK